MPQSGKSRIVAYGLPERRAQTAEFSIESVVSIERLFDHAAVEALMEQPESLAEPWYGQLMRTPQIFAYIIQLDRWFKQYRVRIA